VKGEEGTIFLRGTDGVEIKVLDTNKVSYREKGDTFGLDGKKIKKERQEGGGTDLGV